MEENSCVKCPACHEELIVERRRIRVHTARAKKIGGNLCVFILSVFVCVFVYTAFPMPFFLRKNFWSSVECIYVDTVGCGLILLATVIGNLFICFVLYLDRSECQGPMNYLFIIMATSDVMVTCLFLPTRVLKHWIVYKKLWTNDGDKFLKIVEITRTCTTGFASLSILSVTTICILRIYFTVRHDQSLKIPFSLKITTIIIPFMLSTITSVIYFVYMDEIWAHAYNSTATLYAPIFVMFLSLIIMHLIDDFWRCRSDVLSQSVLYMLFLSYLVFWTPWFTVDIFHKYFSAIKIEHYTRVSHVTPLILMAKGCANLPIMVYLDARFRYSCSNILLRLCCPCGVTYDTLNNDLLMRQNESETTELSLERSTDEQFREVKQSLI